MEENPRRKKVFIYGIIVIIIAGLGFLIGPRLLASYYVNKGAGFLNQGDLSAAKTKFERAISLNSRESLAYFYLAKIALGKSNPGGELYYPNADYAEAIDQFETASKNNLKSANLQLYSVAMNDLGYSYWMAKQYERADEKFRERVVLSPGASFLARYLLALDGFERFNKPDEALRMLVPAASSAVEDVQKNNLYRVYTLLARLYFFKNDPTNAEESASLAVKSAPENTTNLDLQIAHLLLGLEKAMRKDSKGALEEYNLATALAKTLYKSDNTHQCLLAQIYYYLGDTTKASNNAEAKLASLTSFSYLDSVCLQTLAKISLDEKDHAEAKQYMQRYLAETEKFTEKNIFLLRNREEFQKILNEL